MKKTIALLLAMAGMAMGSTPINITWDGNTASLTESVGAGKDISIAITLNWNAFIMNSSFSNVYVLNTDNNTSYALCRAGSITSTGVLFGGTDIYDPYYGEIYDGIINIGGKNGLVIDREVSYATSVYTLKYEGLQYTLTNNLYLWDEKGGLIASDSQSSNWDYGFGNYTQLSINEAFLSSDDVSIYNTAFSVEESVEIAKGLLPGSSTPEEPAVPEPTTATLSLLALSALAVRRRRR